MLCHNLVPGNVSDVNHSVVISGEDTLVKIIFHVSLFVTHGWHVQLYRLLIVMHELYCSSTHVAASINEVLQTKCLDHYSSLFVVVVAASCSLKLSILYC